MKKATTIEEQLDILKNRGMSIDIDEEKAKEILLDIGYFRLGFYCFPFEKTYPRIKKRDHAYREGAKFSDVVKLYYLDVNLRHLLTKYINRIEVNFRTKVTYEASLYYQNSNTWFVDPNVMEKKYIDAFDAKVYNDAFKRNNVIKIHHRKHINDRYAPAWKTMEFITFGGVLKVFKSLKSEEVKKIISKHYEIDNIYVFENYIHSIIQIRNVCAHGAALFDFTLEKSIKNGPALKITNQNKNKL
ncbi:Abi family protein, partial [Parabacteroides sp. OttesenSCG-928-O15]|nr:Abi family protein [Parabacteroides sp. OttesenSCG-928-O15]